MGIGIRIEELRRSTIPPRRWQRGGPASPGVVRAPGARQKKFEVQALDGISLEIRPRSVRIAGADGAGKTTTIAVLDYARRAYQRARLRGRARTSGRSR